MIVVHLRRPRIRRPIASVAIALASALLVAGPLAGCGGPGDASADPTPVGEEVVDRVGHGRVVAGGYVNDHYGLGLGFRDTWTEFVPSRDRVTQANGDGWHTLLVLNQTDDAGRIVSSIDVNAVEPTNSAYASLLEPDPIPTDLPDGIRIVDRTIEVAGRTVRCRTTNASGRHGAHIVVPVGRDLIHIRWWAASSNLLDRAEMVVRTLTFSGT